MADFDISGWAPRWAPARDQLRLQRTNLLALRGHHIVDSWLVWDLEHNEWFADLPVVLSLDNGQQLEVSWQKFDDLSITWNTIDVLVTPTGWVTWPLHWRSQGHESLRAITGNAVTYTAASEYRFTTRRVAPPSASSDATSTWLIAGLWLATDNGGLHIFNALDENGLSSNAPPDGQDHRLLTI